MEGGCLRRTSLDDELIIVTTFPSETYFDEAEKVNPKVDLDV
jgi:hypothetical protein